MENKILVTGATGNIGKEVINLLKAKNTNFAAGTTSGKLIEGVETIKLDFADKTSLEKAMQGVSTLFMLMPGHPDTVQWGKNIIDTVKKTGVKHIVRSTAFLAKKDSSFEFMKLLHRTDKDVINSGLNYTITAPQHFMQNFITALAEDYKNGAVYTPTGEGKVGWVDLRDIAAVNVEVLLNPDKFINQKLRITGSESLSYGEAVKEMNKVLGKETQFVAVPAEVAIKAMEEKHFPPFFIDALMDLNNAVLEGHAHEVTDTLEKVTGNKPISFEQFVKDNKNVWL